MASLLPNFTGCNLLPYLLDLAVGCPLGGRRSMTIALHRRIAMLLAAIPLAFWGTGHPALAADHGLVRGAYQQTNMVSNIPGMAQATDSNLKNPWGLSSSPT